MSEEWPQQALLGLEPVGIAHHRGAMAPAHQGPPVWPPWAEATNRISLFSGYQIEDTQSGSSGPGHLV